MQATAIPIYFRIFLTTSYSPEKRPSSQALTLLSPSRAAVFLITNAFKEVGMRLLERQEPNLS
jgi:hypothetical protein